VTVVSAAAPTPGAPERAAVRSMFDRIAPRYDLLNRVLSAGTDVRWRRRAVDFLELPPPLRLLDLCSGTADLLIEGVARHPASCGLGVDLAQGMLERGACKLGRRGLARRAWLAAGDAERLPVRAGCYDAALVGFGIRNVANPSRALAEVHRALRPGGRFVVLEFSMPEGLIGRLYRGYFKALLPWIGGLVSGDRTAYAYLPASVASFPKPEEFLALMGAVGFVGLRRAALSFGIAHLYRGEKAP
jgi:demethylmenaquinone methyltransferase/2-methoxy-6-polyprenyl-1,4-benzoquinol methylase